MAFKPSSTSFKLLPEHFPLIASHLPLYAAPPTLLALGLTNKWIFEIVHNLLYSRLVLRSEKDAIIIFQRILADPSLGREVRELHVMSELSAATIARETPFDTVTGLQRVTLCTDGSDQNSPPAVHSTRAASISPLPRLHVAYGFPIQSLPGRVPVRKRPPGPSQTASPERHPIKSLIAVENSDQIASVWG